MSGLDQARHAFSEAGVALPPIPERFESDLRTTAPWCFSTRAIDPDGMYMFDTYLREALTTRTPDYLAFSHAGHGINSYALNYHVVDGPLVLIVQAPFGGGYMSDAETTRVSAQFERCRALIAAVERATARGLKAQSGRLCVFESELRGLFAWDWLNLPLDNEDDVGPWMSQHRVPGTDVGAGSVPDHALPTNAAREWLDSQRFALCGPS